MKKPTFTRAILSDVRVIMVIMRVLVGELLCQEVMGAESSTRVRIVRCTWSSVVTSSHVWH
jgi:hypothetical protein